MISVNNENPVKRVHIFNMVYHVWSFTLKGVKFFKILSKHLEFKLRVKDNRRLRKVDILLS
jgi:hypothetical protein